MEPEEVRSQEHTSPEDALIPPPSCRVFASIYYVVHSSPWLPAPTKQLIKRPPPSFPQTREQKAVSPCPICHESPSRPLALPPPQSTDRTLRMRVWCGRSPAHHCPSVREAGPLRKVTWSQIPLGRYSRTHFLSISSHTSFSHLLALFLP